MKLETKRVGIGTRHNARTPSKDLGKKVSSIEGRKPSSVKKQVEEHVADQLQDGEIMMKIEETNSFYNLPSKVTKEEEPLHNLFGEKDKPLGALKEPTTIAKGEPLIDFSYSLKKAQEEEEMAKQEPRRRGVSRNTLRAYALLSRLLPVILRIRNAIITFNLHQICQQDCQHKAGQLDVEMLDNWLKKLEAHFNEHQMNQSRTSIQLPTEVKCDVQLVVSHAQIARWNFTQYLSVKEKFLSDLSITGRVNSTAKGVEIVNCVRNILNNNRRPLTEQEESLDSVTNNVKDSWETRRTILRLYGCVGKGPHNNQSVQGNKLSGASNEYRNGGFLLSDIRALRDTFLCVDEFYRLVGYNRHVGKHRFDPPLQQIILHSLLTYMVDCFKRDSMLINGYQQCECRQQL
ncbi:hypothetical protein KI387_020434, partial [Taxus chinensis]